VFCSLEMPCLLQSPDRILPPADFVEAESSSKSGDMDTCKDSSLNLSAAEDIAASRVYMHKSDTSLFDYTVAYSHHVNPFSPPSDCSSGYELVAPKNNFED